jgi:adenosylcobinamide kinase / adenosylcobinamide-phosphate guanylyltransferase
MHNTMRELILGGQKSGKSRLAEERSRAWLAQSSSHRAVLIATGLAHDEEMRERIARHQADRLLRLPKLRCVEEPRQLGAALAEHSDAQTLVVMDCITLWLTNLLMPVSSEFLDQKQHIAGIESAQSATDLIVSLHAALAQVKGPVVMVSNEIGLGVIPLGREVRQFVDELGKLNQELASQCERVTFMAAGCALTMKEPS